MVPRNIMLLLSFFAASYGYASLHGQTTTSQDETSLVATLSDSSQEQSSLEQNSHTTASEATEDILDFDELSIDEEFLKQIEETAQKEMSFADKIELLMTYLKVKALDAKEHVQKHQNQYLLGSACTVGLILSYFIIKYLTVNKKKNN